MVTLLLWTNSATAQAPVEYSWRGRPNFTYNPGNSTNVSKSRGTYRTGTQEFFLCGGMNDYTSTVSCGNVSGVDQSYTQTISSTTVGTTAYDRRIVYPAYQGAQQTVSNDFYNVFNCGDLEERSTFFGSCNRNFPSTTEVGRRDYSVSVVDFSGKGSFSLCATSSPTVNLRSTVFWTYISVPKDYGTLYFTGSNTAVNNAISGNTLNLAALTTGSYVITANLPMMANGVARATITINVVNPPAPNAGADVETYEGQTVNLFTGAGTTTGTWSVNGGSLTGSNFTVAEGSITGSFINYTATLTSGTGCTSSDTKIIKVYNKPSNATLTATNLSRCLDEGNVNLVPYTDAVFETVWFHKKQGTTDFSTSTAGIQNNIVRIAEYFGEGTHTFKMLVRNKAYAAASVEKEFTILVRPVTDFTFNTIETRCISDGIIELQEYTSLNTSFSVITGTAAALIGTQFYPNINGVGTVTIRATFTNSDGCSRSRDRTFSINGFVSPPAVTPNQTVCIEQGNVTLTGTPTGGVWSGPGINANTGQINLNTAGTGIKQYTYTVSSQGFCVASSTSTVTINSAPTVFAGDDLVICSYNSSNVRTNSLNFASLNFSPSGGTWSSDDTQLNSLISNSTGTLDLSSFDRFGTFKFRYSVSSGSCTSFDEVNLTLAYEQTADVLTLQPGNVCESGSVSLNVVNSKSSQYDPVWYISETASSSLSTGNSYTTPSISQNTTYWVAIRNIVTGCVSQKLPIVAVVNPRPQVFVTDNIYICNVGETINLNEYVNVTGGTFTSPFVTGTLFNSTLVSGDGTYIVNYLYTDPTTNCSRTIDVPVIVGSNLNVNAGTDRFVCEGGPVVNLNATPAGGTWSSTNSEVNNAIDNSQARLNLSGLLPGAYTLRYSIGDINGCFAFDDINLTIEGKPEPETLDDVTICSGTTASLRVRNVTTGQLVNWYLQEGSTTPFETSVELVTPQLNVNTNYFYELVGSTGCPSDRKRVTVFVNSPPVINIGEDLFRCDNNFDIDLRQFEGTFTGGVWTGPNVSNGIFTANNLPSGQYQVTYTFNDPVSGCGSSDSKNITIGIIPNPSVSENLINSGDGVQFDVNNKNLITSIEWDFGDGFKSTDVQPFHYYLTPGVYDVKLNLTLSTGCSESFVFEGFVEVIGEEIEIITSSKEEVGQTPFVYPNPVTNSLKLSKKIEAKELYLMDMKGNTLYKTSNLSISPNDNILDKLNNTLAPGMYFLIINESSANHKLKFVKR